MNGDFTCNRQKFEAPATDREWSSSRPSAAWFRRLALASWLLTAVWSLFSAQTSANDEVPILKTVPGNYRNFADQAPVAAVRSDGQGRVYVLSEQSKTPSSSGTEARLRIYPISLSADPMTNILVRADFQPTALEVSGNYIFVAGHLRAKTGATVFRYTTEETEGGGIRITGAPIEANISTGTTHCTVTGMALSELSGRIHVVGSVNDANYNYLASYDMNLVSTGARKEWHWPTSLGTTALKILNGSPTAIAADASGNIFVAGYWQDPGDSTGHNTSELYSIQTQVGFTTGATFRAYRDGFDGQNNGANFHRTTPYIVKFDSNHNQTAFIEEQFEENNGFITDLKAVNLSGAASGSYIYALQEFESYSTLGKTAIYSYDLPGGANTYDVIVTRLTSNLVADSYQSARIASGAGVNALGYSERAKSFSVDSEGNMYIVGVIQPQLPVKFYKGTMLSADLPTQQFSIAPTSSSFFCAKLNPNLSWAWAVHFSGTYVPADIQAAAYLPGNRVLLGGALASGALTLKLPGASPQESTVKAIVGDLRAGFLTLLDAATGQAIPEQSITVRSAHGIDGVTITRSDEAVGSGGSPGGVETKRTAVVGKSYTVAVSPVLYVGSDGVVMQDPTQADIETHAVTRYVNTGFTVAGANVSGASSSYTFVFERPITIEFQWRVEHALSIDSQLEDTHATFSTAANGWVKDSRGYGLTTKAAANPEPSVNKHWIEENAITTASIDGIAYESGQLGVRYAIAGYDATGAAAGAAVGTVNQKLTPSQSRQQVLPDQNSGVGFAMRGPATITWRWKPQFQISQSTSSSRSADLAATRENGLQFKFTTGSGQFWFDEHASVIVAARSDAGPGRSLRGVRFGGGLFAPVTASDTNGLTAGFAYNGGSYVGSAIADLTASATVIWDFGDPIYKQYVSLGNPVSFDPVSFAPALSPADAGIIGLIDTNIPPRPRIISAPSGSVDTDMQAFDSFDHKSFPLRPAAYFLEWTKRPPFPADDTGVVIMEIHSGFAGDKLDGTNILTHPVVGDGRRRHYRHLTHAEMPAVALDPSPTDTNYFSGLKFTESDGTVVGGGFVARQPGRHVLLFTQVAKTSPPGAPSLVATGDPTQERLAVRIVETRPWNATNSWADSNQRMLKTNAAPALIGSKLVNTAWDRANLQSGFLVYTNARYNGNIYNRSRPNAGPIIPVNRHFTAKEEDRLTVVWYENSDTDAGTVVPSNLLWPWQSEVYANQIWPTLSSLTVVPPNQPLDRIVIASRLGSEGRNHAHEVQTSFDPLLYDQVKIYNQPDRSLPGFNPNEEHALIAPSFKQLDLPSPPPTAYALRLDLNVTTPDANYTSDPYVLVEYYDKTSTPPQFKMAVYTVEKEDSFPDLNPYRYPEMEADPRDLAPVLAELNATSFAGRKTQPNWVTADLSSYSRTALINFQTEVNLDLATRADYPPALIARGFLGHFITNTEPALRLVLDAPFGQSAANVEKQRLRRQVALDFAEAQLAAAEKADAAGGNLFPRAIQAGHRALDRLKATQREFPYTFKYFMKAGEPVQPPYPLPFVVGLTPCSASAGYNFPLGQATTNRVYWEDHKGGAWAVSQGYFSADVYYPLSPSFWFGEGTAAVAPGSCVRFPTENEAQTVARIPYPTGVRRLARCTINGVSITLAAAGMTGLINAINSSGAGVQAANWNNRVKLSLTTPGTLKLLDGLDSPLLNAGLLAPGQSSAVEGASTNVNYTASWPEVLPVLKAGETLTFAGGEYKADHPDPDQPGLPGVLGWASGQIIYDALNPSMNNTKAFSSYTAQLISPLEERQVSLKGDLGYSDEAINAFRQVIQPARSLTKTVGVRWQFVGFSASLGKRLFYDPIKNTLGFKGLLNDKALGDPSLTAPPPPIYVLEPDILTFRERAELLGFEKLKAEPVWKAAVAELYRLGRNPRNIHNPAGEGFWPYYPGLELDGEQKDGGDKLDDNGNRVIIAGTARPRHTLGPGLALVPSPLFLKPDSGSPDVSYVTLVENNDPKLGGPISLFIVKVDRSERYRGAIKTILSDNVFDEKITLRHTGDFGGNGDDIVYQWFYREENGAPAPLPPSDAWSLFPDSSDEPVKGRGQYHISLDGSGGLLLGDNLFFARYRHVNDIPFGDATKANSANWGAPRLAGESGNAVPPFGTAASAYGTEWNRDGSAFRDGEQRNSSGLKDLTNPLRFGGQWAGAANSPTVDLEYRPQLVMGWIKRVLDRVNPYEARFNDFRNNESPATYASMIQQAGQPYVGPVALNPDKNVVENVGLIELYQTVLDRGINLSIGLSSPLSTPGINNALLLAATRISDLYMVLGNEAYTDALDPTIGFGSASVEYGSLAPSVFAFQNQLPSLLDEEMALLRGIADDRRRPMHNRLFWNFTKGEGEVAYAMNYNIQDVNQDGFIDENDALIQYPQGHGDAWGHYLTAIKSRYRLLRHPFFSWQPRSEFYNLLDVVIDVDFLDERKFAETAAAKAQAGTEILNLTYRSRYVEDPDGQWQGYTDPNLPLDSIPRDDWGVSGWARRTGQGALFDWMTANAILPASDTNHTGVQKVDRSTVTELATIAANLGSVQNTYDNANNGLNPIGLNPDVVSFDIDPTFLDVGSTAQIGRRAVQGLTHFEQILERAFAATKNALTAFDFANENKNRLRQVADNVESFRQDVIEQDNDYRNRLIEIFGTPYDGAIGTGKPYPAGYHGPDLSLYMYVDVREVTADTVPAPSKDYKTRLYGFATDMPNESGPFAGLLKTVFLDPLNDTSVDPYRGYDWWTGVRLTDDSIIDLKLPASAGTYTFQAPQDWGSRAASGRLQTIISDMVQTEAELGLAVGDYDALILQIEDAADLLEAKIEMANRIMDIKLKTAATVKSEGKMIQIINAVKDAVAAAKGILEGAFAATRILVDIWGIVGVDNGTNAQGAVAAGGVVTAEEAAKQANDALQEAAVAAVAKGGTVAAVNAAKEASDAAKANVVAARANFTKITGKAATDSNLLEAKDAYKAEKASRNFKKSFTEGADSKFLGSSADTVGAVGDLIEQFPQLALAILESDADKNIEYQTQYFEIYERIKELQQIASSEGTARIKVFEVKERLRSLADQYLTALDEGFRVVEERRNFNVKTAAATQKNRYQDMAFRVGRNKALAQYRASFDLAQKYVYMAAKAYDYETNLSPDDRASAQPLLNEIIRQRTLGRLQDDEPAHGAGGLSEIMATLRDNFMVLEGQLGLNNPQLEENHFSLRSERFGISHEESGLAGWQNELASARIADLWSSQEFRRYCRPFASSTNGPEPGFIFRFPTDITSRKNFFGRALSPGDSAYDPSNYATRIRAAAVKLQGYDVSRMSATPRVYLVPTGLDRMYYPNSRDLRVRDWSIVDQRIPAPFKTGKANLNDPGWIPAIDSLNGILGEIRRYSSFRAVPVGDLGSSSVNLETGVITFADSEPDDVYDTRLTARSIWNTEWLLIIPGSSLLSDPALGVSRFMDSVQDITLTFQTYGNSGN